MGTALEYPDWVFNPFDDSNPWRETCGTCLPSTSILESYIDNQYADVRAYIENLAQNNYSFTWEDCGYANNAVFPDAPALTDPVYTTPAAPTLITPTTPVQGLLASAPEFGEDTPELETGTLPGPAPEIAVGEAPGFEDIAFPAVPTLTTPVFEPLSFLQPPPVSITPVGTDITVPPFSLAPPSTELQYTETVFDDTVLTDLQSNMTRVRGGDFSITAPIWQNIFDRATSQLRREAIARERKGRRAWAALGWELPGGIALASAEEAAQSINESTAIKALEIAVQEAVQKDEQFWKSMEQGVAIERQFFDLWNAKNDRALRFAIALAETSVAIYNAQVAYYNAQLVSVTAQIEAARLQIENQKLLLENGKLQIQAAALVTEENKARAQVYSAAWDGVKAQADVYKTQVDAVATEVEAKKNEVQAFGIKVEAYKAEVEAWAKQWDGYSAQMQGEKVKVDLFDSLVRAYSARVGAYSAEVQQESSNINAQINSARLQIEQNNSQLNRYATEWRAIADQLGAKAQFAQARASIYSSAVQGQLGVVQADKTAADVCLENSKAEQDAYFTAAKLQSEELIAQVNSYQKIGESLAAIYGQLVSAVYSTYSHSVQYSYRKGQDENKNQTIYKSTNFNYDCDC